jgi:sorbitol-6-phosphate 2-dehydrogenase
MTIMDEKMTELARRWAPTLRGLLATDVARLPLVTFEATSAACDAATLLAAGCDSIEQDKELTEKLRGLIADHKKTHGAAPTRVTVPCGGVFTIKPQEVIPGRLAGKLAIVTGGAQGFGYEIASAMAAQGARVALADINLEGAQASAEKLNVQIGAERAVAIKINVADSASVAEAFDAVLAAWGGLDVLVANAGVLRAGSLAGLAESDFDFVTKVNYKGYYLSVRAAAPIMARQHRAMPEYLGDIIQINSKSGLEGSKKNFAYAGGKFGGIGLTQSFALELVEDGIKVNSICPGNFFDGPLWSDPKNGLFVQYLSTNKVPGAKTIADVKKFYEAKVPMGRGCEGPDVMKAIYYLIEQQYETGQAVPVTGGQVMLN